MANIKSAKKRILVNRTKAERNKAIRSGVKTAIKKVHAAIEANDKSAGIRGVRVEETYDEENEIKVTKVVIETKNGAKAMGKPMGIYVTLEAPGMVEPEEPVFVICIVLFKRFVERAASASMTITTSGFVCSTTPFMISALSIPVFAITPGTILLTICIRDLLYAAFPYSFTTCLVINKLSATFGPSASECVDQRQSGSAGDCHRGAYGGGRGYDCKRCFGR